MKSAGGARTVSIVIRRMGTLFVFGVFSAGWGYHSNATAAVLEASYFGFSASADNNYAAMRALEEYANLEKTVSVRFFPGTYVVDLPENGEPGYRGGQQAACWFRNVSGVTIDAREAWFYTPDSSPEWALFRFSDSKNIKVHAKFRGTNYGIRGNGKDGIKAIHLWAGNDGVDLEFEAVQMFDGVRVGGWATETSKVDYSGNKNITINAVAKDTYYTAVVTLAENVVVRAQSHGTAEGGYGAHRVVYLAGVDNVDATSKSWDINITDGVNLITTQPSVRSPYHVGSSNVRLYAEDAGTSLATKSRKLAKIGVVTNYAQSTSIVHRNIHVTISLTANETQWLDNSAFAIGSRGVDAAHRLENITLSGTFNRPTSPSLTIHPAIIVEGNADGLSYVDLDLVEFHDIGSQSIAPHTITVSQRSATVRINGYRSTVGRRWFVSPIIQTYTDHGDANPPQSDLPDDPPPLLLERSFSVSPTVLKGSEGKLVKVTFHLERPAAARVSVRDRQGKEVKLIYQGTANSGPHACDWDGTNQMGERVASGSYMVVLTYEGETKIKKVVVVR